MPLTRYGRAMLLPALAALIAACAPQPPVPREVSQGHLSGTAPAPAAAPAPSSIPQPVTASAYLPPPGDVAPEETYTVVVNDVPVRELLFALARDASVNVDVHPQIQGSITLNAIDQSLFQILDRISRQLDVRYEKRGETIAIVPDTPFLRTYKVDYVNVTRGSDGSISASTLVASTDEGGGASGNNVSVTTIKNQSTNEFWETLESTLDDMVAPAVGQGQVGGQKRVIVNRENGLLLVRATTSQHELVQSYLDRVMVNATRQVLIEATIVEVELNDRYQAGIDWRVFTRESVVGGAGLALGADVASAFTAGASGLVTGLIFTAADAPQGSDKRSVEVSISLLNEFGDAQVLSSPKVMTLNNQPAVLKVVDNEVYFDIEIDINQNESQTVTTVESEARTVAVGLVMNVTPQISAADQVTLNIRPTVTRVREFVQDPAVAFLDTEITSEVPVVQVRETETVMRVGTGQLAVLGGLMQDTQTADDEAVPGLSDIPVGGELFNFRDRTQRKTELVVFLRPTVIRTPDVRGDLANFTPYLPENLERFQRIPTPLEPLPGLTEEAPQ